MLKITKINPVATRMLVTGEVYSEDMYNEHGIIESKKGDMKEYQTVIAVGPMVREIKVGDTVMLNMMHFAVMQYDSNSIKKDMGMQKIKGYQFPKIELTKEDGSKQECLYIDQQDIVFSFEGEEVQGKKNPIITPEKKDIILN
jgi:hypothetical protein